MQVLINIFISFSLYLIISNSFSVLYLLTKHFIFTQAVIISLGAYLSYLFITTFHLVFYLSIPLAIICCIIIGLLSDVLIYNLMRKKNMPPFAYIVTSIGLYIILQNLISLFFGDETKTLNSYDIMVGNQFNGAYITTIQIITILFSLLLYAYIYLLFNYTDLGKEIRAVSENTELATIYGISSNKIILICFGIGSGLGAIAGVLSAYDTSLSPTMGFNLLLVGIVVMIIGGVGNFRGLLFGSLLVATAQNLVAYYIDTKWMDSVVYFILIIFLLWKPLGFSGNRLKKIEI